MSMSLSALGAAPGAWAAAASAAGAQTVGEISHKFGSPEIYAKLLHEISAESRLKLSSGPSPSSARGGDGEDGPNHYFARRLTRRRRGDV